MIEIVILQTIAEGITLREVMVHENKHFGTCQSVPSD